MIFKKELHLDEKIQIINEVYKRNQNPDLKEFVLLPYTDEQLSKEFGGPRDVIKAFRHARIVGWDDDYYTIDKMGRITTYAYFAAEHMLNTHHQEIAALLKED